MAAYYNEVDRFAAAWLRELIREGLIADGEVDERSVVDVRPDDLRGFVQCHFFAGIGGWSYALRLAGWADDRPVWTGSCPCQPFSVAGKGAGVADERHLWPEFYRLIKACRPEVVIGEQVASADVVGSELEAAFVVAVQKGEYARANKLAKRLAQSRSFHYAPRWIDGVSADMEALRYAMRFKVLGSHSVRAWNIRLRLYWVADTDGWNAVNGDLQRGRLDGLRAEDRDILRDSGDGQQQENRLADTDPSGLREQRRRGLREDGDAPSGHDVDGCGTDGWMGDATRGGLGIDGSASRNAGHSDESGEIERMGDSDQPGPQGRLCGGNGSDECAPRPPGMARVDWSRVEWLPCLDGKSRPVEPGLEPLASGIPARVGRLRGYGNAINVEVAAAFIESYLEAKENQSGMTPA